jgi:hypothetical protein
MGDGMKAAFILATVTAAITLASSVTRAQDSRLVGKHVAVHVGSVVEIPSNAAEAQSPALRHVVIADTTLTEIAGQGQGAPLLLPPPGGRIEGNVLSVDGEGLKVRLLGRLEVVTVPRPSISSLWVHRRRSRIARGALIGAGVGAAAGIASVIAIESGNCRGDNRGWCTVGDVATATATVAGGTVIGTVVGVLSRTERWERTYVDGRKVSVAVVPDRHGGIRGRLAVRF